MRKMKLMDIVGKIERNAFVVFNKRKFKFLGKRARVIKPLHVDGIQSISIGEKATIHEGTWLAAVPLTGCDVQLSIGDRTTIGHFNHIYATKSIIIEEDVLTADKVYISDNFHSYEDVSLPIKEQPIKQCKPVVIGKGSWLGENVCVCGSSVGKHCVIGANAVVTHDIPDYCVAVGAPAKVIKIFDFSLSKWITI